MSLRYLPIALIFFVQSLSAQTTDRLALAGDKGDGLLALSTGIASEKKTLSEDFTFPALPNRGSAGAGEGIKTLSFYESLGLGASKTTTKYGTHSATAGGFAYEVEIGAKVPLLIINQHIQFAITGAVMCHGFTAKDVFTDTAATKNKFGVASFGVPLNATIVGLNKNGRIVGYYFDIGVNLTYVVDAGDGHGDAKKQFNGMVIQPNCGLGLAFNLDGGEKLNNRTMMFGFFVADVVNNMAKTSGVTFNTMSYGLRYTSLIN
jgi:hypothetical protein